MELLAQFIAPIAGLWVIRNAILSSARFVNEMRETVISSFHAGRPITAEHQRAIRFDWALCVVATVAVCLIFGTIVVAATVALSTALLTKLIGFAIAAYPFVCAGGFALCSTLDWRLMSVAIKDNSKRAKDPPAAVDLA